MSHTTLPYASCHCKKASLPLLAFRLENTLVSTLVSRRCYHKRDKDKAKSTINKHVILSLTQTTEPLINQTNDDIGIRIDCSIKTKYYSITATSNKQWQPHAVALHAFVAARHRYHEPGHASLSEIPLLTYSRPNSAQCLPLASSLPSLSGTSPLPTPNPALMPLSPPPLRLQTPSHLNNNIIPHLQSRRHHRLPLGNMLVFKKCIQAKCIKARIGLKLRAWGFAPMASLVV